MLTATYKDSFVANKICCKSPVPTLGVYVNIPNDMSYTNPSPWCGGRTVQGAVSSSLAIYGVIHISLGYISAQVRILGVSCHLFICTFHFTLHFEWPACL